MSPIIEIVFSGSTCRIAGSVGVRGKKSKEVFSIKLERGGKVFKFIGGGRESLFTSSGPTTGGAGGGIFGLIIGGGVLGTGL